MKPFVLTAAFVTLAIPCLAQNDVPQEAPPHARISGGVMAGMRTKFVPPVYPEKAKAAGISGTVVLHAIISKDGTVKELQAISGPDMLKESAITAVKKWTYKPYLLNGEPTEVDTTITINYNIGTSPPPSSAPLASDSADNSPQPDSINPDGSARLSGGIVSGMRTNFVQPVYPSVAKSYHISGTVLLHATIGKTGHVENLEVISGPGLLRDAAMDAVKQWVYRPYMLNGQPTVVDTTITVNFFLNGH